MQELNLQKLAPYIDLSDVTTAGIYTRFIDLENMEGIILEDVLQANVQIEVHPKPTEPADEPIANEEDGIAEDAGTEME